MPITREGMRDAGAACRSAATEPSKPLTALGPSEELESGPVERSSRLERPLQGADFVCWGSAACSRAKRRQEGLLYVDKERGLPLLAILRLARTSLLNAVMQLDRCVRARSRGACSVRRCRARRRTSALNVGCARALSYEGDQILLAEYFPVVDRSHTTPR